MFDALVDELRNDSIEWLETRHREVVGAQRKLHAEALALVGNPNLRDGLELVTASGPPSRAGPNAA